MSGSRSARAGATHLGGALLLALAGMVVLGLACGNSDGGTATGGPNAAPGARVAAQRGCTGCHTVNGRPSVGPTWKGIFGSEVELADGSKVMIDEAYVERSIRQPSAQIVEGFSAQMPRIDLSDDEVAALVDYIRSLR